MVDIFQEARLGEIDVLKQIHASGGDLTVENKYGENILFPAIVSNYPEIVDLAIAAGVNVNKQTKKYKRSPLHVAAELKQFETCDMLLRAGANIFLEEYLNRHPLWYACWLPKGDYRIAQLLLEAGADPCHVEINGFSPLTFAKEVTDFQLVELLGKYV